MDILYNNSILKFSPYFAFKKHRAFTLAEVLITLLIIGVVASLVIPGLINNTNEAELNVGVKKAYADISSAVKMIQVQNGSVNVGLGNTVANEIALRNDFANVMNFVKVDNFANIFTANGVQYKWYKGSNSTVNTDASAQPSAILSNGSFLSFESFTNCSYNSYSINACGAITVDINGSKGPNMFGKDLYAFWITNNNGAYSALPFGVPGDIRTCVNPGTGYPNSQGCTAKRISDPDHMP